MNDFLATIRLQLSGFCIIFKRTCASTIVICFDSNPVYKIWMKVNGPADSRREMRRYAAPAISIQIILVE